MKKAVGVAIALTAICISIFIGGIKLKDKATKVVDSIGFVTVFSELDKALE